MLLDPYVMLAGLEHAAVHAESKSPLAFAERASVLVAGVGFEPTTFGLWLRRAARLLHPAARSVLGLMWRVNRLVNYVEWSWRLTFNKREIRRADWPPMLPDPLRRQALFVAAVAVLDRGKVDEAMMMAGPRQESNLYLALRRHTSHLPLSLILQGIPVVFKVCTLEWDTNGTNAIPATPRDHKGKDNNHMETELVATPEQGTKFTPKEETIKVGSGTVVSRTKKDGSKSYQAKVRKNGVNLSQTCASLKEAKEWITKTEAKLLNGESIAPNKVKKITLTEVFQEYLKDNKKISDNKKGRIERLILEIGKVSLEEFKTRFLFKWMEFKLSQEIPDQAKRRNLTSFSTAIAPLTKKAMRL